MCAEEEGDPYLLPYRHRQLQLQRPRTLYTDLGLLTCRPELGNDLVNLFHFSTGYAPEQSYAEVLVAPDHMRSRFEALIAREIDHQARFGNGRVVAKMNGLDDPAYDARRCTTPRRPACRSI